MTLDQVPRDKVGLGSRVTVLDLDTDQETTYELVIPEVADSAKGLISMASPIGRGLVGREPGDEVSVAIPSGERNFEILELITVHDRESDSEA